MRKLPLLPSGVAISAAVHVAIVAWVGAHEPPDDVRALAPRAATPIEIVPRATVPEAPALDVQLLDPAATAAIQPLPPVPASPLTAPAHDRAEPERAQVAAINGREGERRGATGTERATEAPDPGPEPGRGTPGPRSPLFDMRRGKLDLALPGTFRDDLDRVPRGTTPDRGVAPTGQLAPSGGGTHRSDQGTFVAKVARDGSVTLSDKRNFHIGVAAPTPRTVGQGVSRWYRSDKGPDGQRGEQALKDQVTGTIDMPRCQARDNACAGDRSKAVVVPVLRGGFDVTDWLMRRQKMDPYASKKLAFLDSTRDERVELGKHHRAQQLQQTAFLMRRNLERLWSSLTDPAARKQALFELWDEIVEGGADEVTDEVVAEAGRSARKQVVGFIRARLPERGPHAYTATELAALNRQKQSKATFAPYH